jgi:charged multivesicular body protein 1
MDQNPEPPKEEKKLTDDEMFDKIFEFKMMAKQFAKESKKAENEHKKFLAKTKSLIEKGNYEQARVAAADAIRKKNEINRYQVLSSKIDGVAQRLQSAMQTRQLTEQMTQLTNLMSGQANKISDIVEITDTLDKFEKMFDDLDVHSNMMNEVMDNVNAGTIDDNEVNLLVNQVAEANGMKVMDSLDVNAGSNNIQMENNNNLNSNFEINK